MGGDTGAELACHLMKPVLTLLTCLDQAEKEDDGGGRGDQFGVHPAGWLLVEI